MRSDSRRPDRQPCAAWAGVVLSALLIAGCATRSADVAPRPGDPAAYAGWSCEKLFEQIDLVQQDAADVAYAVDARVGNNMIALGVGIAVFWPALLAMRPDGPEAAQLAELKGRFEALSAVARAQSCGEPPELMAASRAAKMPVAVGDRLVYDLREGRLLGGAHRLDLTVTALRRDQLEFRVELDGRELASAWRQDLTGNALPGSAPPILTPVRLLRHSLELGQVLDGDLALGGEERPARVRGQVVAIGPQTVAGHNFDVAVIELFGDAPVGLEGGTTRLDGVMAVDRMSGVCLRLEVSSASPSFALRRRLMRIEAGPR
jgi:hypothetical protein